MKWKLKVEFVDDIAARNEEAQFKLTGSMGKAGRKKGFCLDMLRKWRLAFYQRSESGAADVYALSCFQVMNFIAFFSSFNHIIYAQ